MSHPGVAANGGIPPLFEAWTVDPWVAGPLALTAGIYLRGWLRLHARVPQRFGAGHLVAFLDGLTAIVVLLLSRRCMPSEPSGCRRKWSSIFC